MDVCRTLAHELVHFKQDLDNQLEDADAGSTGSPQENEANAKAAVIMRNWGKLHPKLFAQQAVE
jgi:Zn-dependent peptidase ImmA (M78 family)